MKKEVYSCLKMLEVLNNGIKNLWVNDSLESVGSLQKQYSDICGLLKKELSEEEFKMVQIVNPINFAMIDLLSRSDVARGLMQRLLISTEMTLVYLRSLDMDFDKELIKEKIEIKRQKEELESKTKEVESLKRIFENIVSIKEGIPELLRSRVMEEIKGSHRGIENNTNKDTKSQKKVLIDETNAEITNKVIS